MWSPQPPTSLCAARAVEDAHGGAVELHRAEAAAASARLRQALVAPLGRAPLRHALASLRRDAFAPLRHSLASLWLVGAPALALIAAGEWPRALGGRSLGAIWAAQPAIYALLDVLLAASFARADWGRVSREIRVRDGAARGGGDDSEECT